jgi:hypothetical protein
MGGRAGSHRAASAPRASPWCLWRRKRVMRRYLVLDRLWFIYTLGMALLVILWLISGPLHWSTVSADTIGAVMLLYLLPAGIVGVFTRLLPAIQWLILVLVHYFGGLVALAIVGVLGTIWLAILVTFVPQVDGLTGQFVFVVSSVLAVLIAHRISSGHRLP